MSADDGRVYWRQPRWLSRALEDGEINRCEFTLLAYLGGAGLDRFGVSTTLGELSSLLGFTTKWISDSLRRLRAKGLIEFDLGERQRRPFRITEGPALRAATDFRTEFRSQTPVATGIARGADTQDFRSDEGDFRSGDHPQSQEQSAVAPQPTSGTSAVAETETEAKACSNEAVEPSASTSDVGAHATALGVTSYVDAAHAREDTTDDEAFLAALPSPRKTPSPFQPPLLVARRLGDEGFVVFVRALGRLGVLDGDEVRAWQSLHGATMRATLPPLDAGEGVDDATLRELQASLR